MADYERHLESMEKRLEIKTRELRRKEEELKTAMQLQINNCVKLESYEFEVERLRQEKEQLTEQINSLIARDDYINTLAREASENKRQISLALEKIDDVRNSVKELSEKVKDDFLDRILELLPTGILIYDKLTKTDNQTSENRDKE